jgi:4-amino-4-deoxy-L-arabinose transferase-like glycosyltransferase
MQLVRYKFLLFSGLIVLYCLSVLINLGKLNLRVEEPRRAIVTIEMLQSKNFIEPHTMGRSYYNKPPVFNWIMAGLMKITNSDSEFICRLPSVISLLILGLCQFLFSKKYFGKSLAALSAFFTITCADVYFYWLSNGAEIDVFYSLIVYLQIISIFWFYEQRKYLSLFVWSWSVCAIGFFTKGYPSIVFQLLTLAALCIYARSIKIIFKPQHIVGFALFLLLSSSFLYAYSFYNSPRVLLINLLNESLLKSIVGRESIGKFYKVFTYPFVLLRVLAPWCLILFFLLKKHRFHLSSNPLVKFSLLFIALNIEIYWITGAQKTRYIIMFIPFVMNVVIYVFDQMKKDYSKQLDNWLKYFGFGFVLILAGLIALPFFESVDRWKVFLSGIILLVFIFQYFKCAEYRIWLFLTGIILLRLIYATVDLPLKKQSEFDYKLLTTTLLSKNNFRQVRFWGPAYQLDLNVVFVDTLYKWNGAPVFVLPPRVSYQVPYYFYKETGTLMQFDTVMHPGKTYISYKPYIGERKVERLGSYYDNQFGDSLIFFKPLDNEAK